MKSHWNDVWKWLKQYILRQADDTGTKATDDRLQQLSHGLENGTGDGAEAQASKEGSPADDDTAAVPINENLFLDEDLDEELQNLDLED